MNSWVQEIESRAHWRVTIHPSRFDAERIAFDQLVPIVEKCTVELRGWDFPHVDKNAPPLRKLHHVEQASHWQHHAERWMFFRSGLFTSISTVASDWRDRSEWWPAPKDWTPGHTIGLFDVLWTYVEIYEFASRLSAAVPGDDAYRIKAVVGRLTGRRLEDDSAPGRFMFRGGTAVAAIDSFPLDRIHTRESLEGDRSRYAAEAATDLYSRMGLSVTVDTAMEWIRLLKARQL